MKVGIVTIFSDNYGNKLQNLAVQKIVEKFGFEVETILLDVKQGIRPTNGRLLKKFAPSYIFKAMKSRFKNKYLYKNDRDGILKSVHFAKNGQWQNSLKARQQSFFKYTNKYLRLAENKLTLINADEEWLNAYDYFIAGSDQVWNPTYPETSSLNFLQFAPKEKRITFAPSIGLSELPEYVKSLYRKWLNEIPYLSIREEKGAQIIKELTGKDVDVLPDPTLCISPEEWELIEEKPNFDTGAPYVFTYFLGNETNKYRKYIETYAKKNGCKIVNIFDLREPEYYAVNPSEFIYLIHHAKAVFTDSFHGSIFSILMKTPFVVFDRVEIGGNGMSSRLETLLKTFSLEDRKYPVGFGDIATVDFSKCDGVIESLKKKADAFLTNAFRRPTGSLQELCPLKRILQKKEDCSGCSACYNICPKKCIHMEKDEEGFYYPVKDQEKCVECGLCQRICPTQNTVLQDGKPQVYVGYHIDKQVRMKSSSGGIFSALAEIILSMGGWVYGAAFDKSFTVCHLGIDNKIDVQKLRTSKYVQSNVWDVFPIIKQQLIEGKTVYFSGTPCQVEGLLAYLGKAYERLYTQDIICHGVPSPAVWRAYLDLILGEKKAVSFRDKKSGWHYFSMRIQTDKKNYIKRLDEDTYIRLFLDNIILRPSCYACHFKKRLRRADFTLADCWNSTALNLTLRDDDKGLSMIFVNSEKGKNLVAALGEKVRMEQVEYEKALKIQSAATESVEKTEQRTAFFEMAHVDGYQDAIKNWYAKSFAADAKKTFIYIKTKIRNIIKRGG